MKLTPFVLVPLALALAGPATASAAYDLGQDPDFGFLGDAVRCDAPCTFQQSVLSNEELRVPSMPGTSQGVITRWRIAGSGGRARVRRLEIGGDGRATARGATDWAGLTGETQQVTASLPVHTGDAIGVDLEAGTEIFFQESVAGGEQVRRFSPMLTEGAAAAPEAIGAGYIALRVTVEPDADGDGRGDETQDDCVACQPGGDKNPGGGTPPPAEPAPAPKPAPAPATPRGAADPYAAIRKKGPAATIGATAVSKRRRISVAVTNPHAFPVSGTLRLKRGRTALGTAKVKLAAGQTKTIAVSVRRTVKRKAKLTAVVALRGPVGKQARTTKTIVLGKKLAGTTGGGKPAPGTAAPQGDAGSIDGEYKGEGAGADWVMAITDGVVTAFSGTMSLYCSSSSTQQTQRFAMVGDDPRPTVAPDGSFAWEATSGFNLTKLKFSGRVGRDGRVTGNLNVEHRPPRTTISPVSGMPRMEFDYCYAGREYTLTKK